MRINNIIEAIEDENIFKPFLGDLDSWQGWLTALQVLYGLDMKPTKDKAKLIRLCTGWERKPQFAPEGFKTALFLIGRRGGKSRVISIVGAYEATLAGHHEKLAKGERGILPIIAPTKAQAGIIKEFDKVGILSKREFRVHFFQGASIDRLKKVCLFVR